MPCVFPLLFDKDTHHRHISTPFLLTGFYTFPPLLLKTDLNYRNIENLDYSQNNYLDCQIVSHHIFHLQYKLRSISTHPLINFYLHLYFASPYLFIVPLLMAIIAVLVISSGVYLYKSKKKKQPALLNQNKFNKQKKGPKKKNEDK